jgi:hypothetical protein
MSTALKLVSKVKNGVLPLPRGLRLKEGADVALVPLVALPGDPPFLKIALKLARPRGWPRDFALNHAHYTKGHGKK